MSRPTLRNAALAGLAITSLSGGAQAAEPMIFSKGTVTYTVSTEYTAPTDAGVSKVALPIGMTNAQNLRLTEADKSYAYFSSGGNDAYFLTPAQGSEAIYTAPGTTHTGTALRLRYDLQAQMQSFTAANAMETMRFASFIWGGVMASESLSFGSTQTGGTSITGADILAAAAAQGISGGNSGSYYVSVAAAKGSAGFDTIRLKGSGSTANVSGAYYATYVPLAYSTGANDVDLRAVASAASASGPSAPGGVAGAPAPVMGATPAGGLLGIGLLGFLGIGARRRAAVAA